MGAARKREAPDPAFLQHVPRKSPLGHEATWITLAQMTGHVQEADIQAL
jgi:hypothetical protein